MSLIKEVEESKDCTLDAKFEEDSLKMRNSRTWLVNKACERINELCIMNIKSEKDKKKMLPDEITFKWFNVKTDLMKFIDVLDNDNNYNKDNSPMNYSFDTIYNGGFGTSKGKINRSRLRQAGIKNPFVLDVKREMADKCVKVWDVSDKKVSNKNVWEITIFINEIKKIKDKSKTELNTEENNESIEDN
jgi:hypothetical protein|tara:strand:- start:590 stop:1156 length:567 start_codon:yes stop_codon:yes gene_type:complete